MPSSATWSASLPTACAASLCTSTPRPAASLAMGARSCSTPISLFAANEGYIDDVEVNKVVDFEAALQAHMKSNYSDFMDEVNSACGYNDDVEKTLHDAVKDFKANGSW